MILAKNEIHTAWKNREGPIVLATVDADGVPNAIYASCVSMWDDETIVVADNYFDKTRADILSGSVASVLFVTKDGKSYQIKGDVAYHTQGEIFEEMKRWNPSRHPGHAAAVIKVDQAFSGLKRLI